MANELSEIYQAIKKELKKYEPPLVAKADYDARYDLWSVKDIVIDGRPRKEIAFGAVIIQSSYVGFYFTPIYTSQQARDNTAPELMKLLKGKGCFHVKKLDDELLKHIRDLIKRGFNQYKKNGWV